MLELYVFPPSYQVFLFIAKGYLETKYPSLNLKPNKLWSSASPWLTTS